MKKIRILHIGLTSNMGGIEKYVYNLCEMCDNNKIENEIINANESKVGFEEDFKKLNIKIVKIANRKKHYIKHIKELKKVIKEGDYDFIHFHLMDLSCFDRILIALKASKAQIILHSHINNFNKKMLRSIMDFIGVQLLKYNNSIIKTACSEDAGKYMFKKFKNKEFMILNNSIDVKNFMFDVEKREKIRKKLNITNQFVIGNVGRFQEQKNHNFIIEIFSEILKLNKNSKLLLIGEGELKEKIIQKAKSLNIEKDIIFYGKSNNVNELFQAMDVFLFPSLYEGLGIVLIEAQASGLKCYASQTIPKEVKITDNLKFIDLSKNAKEWAQIIINESKDKYDRKLYNKKVMNTKFNIDEERKRVNDFYERKYYRKES